MEEKIYFESDGLKLCGLLDKQDPKKCIILCHGMKVGKEEKGAFPILSKTIANKGFSVFRFDFRGHGESEGKSEDMTIPGETRDVEAAYEKMKSLGFEEFGILGASFGGGAVAYFAEKHPELKGVIFWNALIDYEEKVNPTTELNKKNYGPVAYKEAEKNGKFKKGENFFLGLQFFKDLKVLKPWESVLKLKMPILFVHGTNDAHVFYSDSVKYSKMCNANLITIKDGEHGFRNKIDEASKAATDFFDKIMINNTKSYTCPNCGKEYSSPPKACSCETIEVVPETKYYFLENKPELDKSESVADIAKEISEEEFNNPEKKGYYVAETFIPGVETVGSFEREVKIK